IFAELPKNELELLQDNFIRAIGGSKGAGRAAKKTKVSTYDVTFGLVQKNLSLKEMAKERGMTEGTILSHLEKLLALKKINKKELEYLKPDSARFEPMKRALAKAAAKDSNMPLSLAKAIAGSSYSFEELRLARLFM